MAGSLKFFRMDLTNQLTLFENKNSYELSTRKQGLLG